MGAWFSREELTESALPTSPKCEEAPEEAPTAEEGSSSAPHHKQIATAPPALPAGRVPLRGLR